LWGLDHEGDICLCTIGVWVFFFFLATPGGGGKEGKKGGKRGQRGGRGGTRLKLLRTLGEHTGEKFWGDSFSNEEKVGGPGGGKGKKGGGVFFFFCVLKNKIVFHKQGGRGPRTKEKVEKCGEKMGVGGNGGVGDFFDG